MTLQRLINLPYRAFLEVSVPCLDSIDYQASVAVSKHTQMVTDRHLYSTDY